MYVHKLPIDIRHMTCLNDSENINLYNNILLPISHFIFQNLNLIIFNHGI